MSPWRRSHINFIYIYLCMHLGQKAGAGGFKPCLDVVRISKTACIYDTVGVPVPIVVVEVYWM